MERLPFAVSTLLLTDGSLGMLALNFAKVELGVRSWANDSGDKICAFQRRVAS